MRIRTFSLWFRAILCVCAAGKAGIHKIIIKLHVAYYSKLCVCVVDSLNASHICTKVKYFPVFPIVMENVSVKMLGNFLSASHESDLES